MMMAKLQNIYLALVHYPIYDRSRKVVSTSVTNLDIHDFSRLARTYNLGGYFIVSPVEDQADMVRRIVGHWKEGYGFEYNHHRAEALKTPGWLIPCRR
jgi:tRNA (guanine37-N1)-methyltransferase